MKKISVIIPVYNLEGYLAGCLDSVLVNAYPKLEIICVDDGSTDGSGNILAEYAERDPRIRVISQENRGVSAARNAGLAAASGEWIVFLDGDDRLHPRFFEIMVGLQGAYGADVVIGGYCDGMWEAMEASRVRVISGRKMMKDRRAKSFVWGRIYRRESLDGVRFREDMQLGEDRAFNLDLVSKFPEMRVVRTERKLYHYRLREDSLVNRTTQDSWIRLAWAMLGICRKKEGLGKALALTESMKMALAARNAGMKGGEALVEACLAEMGRTPGLSWYRRAGYGMMAKWEWIYPALLRIKRSGKSEIGSK